MVCGPGGGSEFWQPLEGCVGVAIPLAVRFFTSRPVSISAQSILAAVGVSALVGVIFGTLPANRAAGRNPVDALRTD